MDAERIEEIERKIKEIDDQLDMDFYSIELSPVLEFEKEQLEIQLQFLKSNE